MPSIDYYEQQVKQRKQRHQRKRQQRLQRLQRLGRNHSAADSISNSIVSHSNSNSNSNSNTSSGVLLRGWSDSDEHGSGIAEIATDIMNELNLSLDLSNSISYSYDASTNTDDVNNNNSRDSNDLDISYSNTSMQTDNDNNANATTNAVIHSSNANGNGNARSSSHNNAEVVPKVIMSGSGIGIAATAAVADGVTHKVDIIGILNAASDEFSRNEDGEISYKGDASASASAGLSTNLSMDEFGGSVSTPRRRITSPYRNTSTSTSTMRSKRIISGKSPVSESVPQPPLDESIDSSTFPTIEVTVSHDTCNSSSPSASVSASDKNAYEKKHYQFDVDQNGNSAARPMSPMSPLTPTPNQRGQGRKRFEVEEDEQQDQDQDQHPNVNVKSSINAYQDAVQYGHQNLSPFNFHTHAVSSHPGPHRPSQQANSNTRREANHLMDVLRKVSKRNKHNQMIGGLGGVRVGDKDDVHMGNRPVTPPRNRSSNRRGRKSKNSRDARMGETNVNINGNGSGSGGGYVNLSMDYDSSSSDESSGDRTPTHAHNAIANANATTNMNGTSNALVSQNISKPHHTRNVSWSKKDHRIDNDNDPGRNSIMDVQQQSQPQHPNSPISAASMSASTNCSYQRAIKYSEYPQPPYSNGDTGTLTPRQRSFTKKREDPTLLAQTFVLSLAFFAIWTPQNLMAPNLTQMANYFHFTSDQRDLYLGANIAFATGVLSLPVSALLGFFADIVESRKRLFAYTTFVGGLAAMATGWSQTYTQLYFCRFLCGGCMSGCVPIAFSILGDLFDAKDRNAASSGLTAMMGGGILLGQVAAGVIGAPLNVGMTEKYTSSGGFEKIAAAVGSSMGVMDVNTGWKRPFYLSGICSLITSFMVLYFVREPVRGGKEKVLQEMIANGTKYDRKLTLAGFLHAMTQNKTNVILMLQGFFTNIPWGVIFTFLNDYLSQEQGLSVAASTFLILWFGIGSASGMVVGGYIGTKAMRMNSALLPLFMAVSTALGIIPFLGLLNLDLTGAGLLAITLAFTGGAIPNFPSANVRPCLLNVNPPETRGATMTAANLMINVARGAGPSLVTLSQRGLGVSRQYSFNLTIVTFWSITTVLLVILATTLPSDQEKMDEELAKYAKSRISSMKMNGNGMAANGDGMKEGLSLTNGHINYGSGIRSPSPTMLDDLEDASEAGTIRSHIHDDMTLAGEESIVSIEDKITSFDANAMQETLMFIEGALREIAELSHIRSRSDGYEAVNENDVQFESRLNSGPAIPDTAPVVDGRKDDNPDQYGIGNQTTL